MIILHVGSLQQPSFSLIRFPLLSLSLSQFFFFFCCGFIFMCCEFNQISFPDMSNSELFLVKEGQNDMKVDVLARPTLEFPDGCHANALNDHPDGLHHQGGGEHNENEEAKCENNMAASENLEKPPLAEFKVSENDVDEDNDGFRTPTSLEHRIPEPKECPPAPKKTSPLRLKRRRVSRNVRRKIQLDLSCDIESIFPPSPRDDDNDFGHQIKKARRDDAE